MASAEHYNWNGELRVAKDGQPYSLSQFMQHYGKNWEQHWEEAARIFPSRATAHTALGAAVAAATSGIAAGAHGAAAAGGGAFARGEAATKLE